ncbi:MAG: putative toxin-antitoxin system toxin component, PIN family [Planctomycetaceae bacterium]|nr:putative toxin-antitoxin system toxin component, PIN family [Planctomycetaceae bacterium]
MKAVIDTNVIVSGLLKPFSASGEIVRMLADGKIQICYDARILLEYEQVLHREKFGFDFAIIEILMGSIKEMGICTTGSPITARLPDPTDEMFVEVASDPHCRLLVTGNGKHFPQKACGNVRVLTPRDFLAFFTRCE